MGRMKKMISDYGINAFEIEDDEFFVDMNRAKKVCELILKDKLNIEIFTTCRINYVDQRMDDELLKLCLKAGFKSLAFGVESGSPKIQELMSKDITNDQVFRTVKRLKDGHWSKHYFIWEHPRKQLKTFIRLPILFKNETDRHKISFPNVAFSPLSRTGYMPWPRSTDSSPKNWRNGLLRL